MRCTQLVTLLLQPEFPLPSTSLSNVNHFLWHICARQTHVFWRNWWSCSNTRSALTFLSQSCPIMCGGPKYEYRWQDNDKYKKPTNLPASEYVVELMQWIELLINDESVFPTKIGMSTLSYIRLSVSRCLSLTLCPALRNTFEMCYVTFHESFIGDLCAVELPGSCAAMPVTVNASI